MQYQFHTVDVFTDRVFGGAQIAVFPQAGGLDDEKMQCLAKEFNLSETVFVEAVDGSANNFNTRIFTPKGEIDFGSHTVLAAAHVLASTGAVELAQDGADIVLDLNTGPLQAHISTASDKPVKTQFSLTVTPIVDEFVPTNSELAAMLALPESAIVETPFRPLLSSYNSAYLVIPITSLEHVRKAKFNFKAWSQSNAPATMAQEILLFSKQTEQADANFHLRLLGPDIGVHEDPPVGSAIPCFTGYLCQHKHIQRGTYTFTAERGFSQQRQSHLHIEMDNKGEDKLTIRVGGQAVMASNGSIDVPS